VSRRPFVVIVVSILLCTICTYGLKFLKQETRPEKLWIPSDAPYVLDSEWVRANFPQVARPEFAIFEANNVLTSEALLQVPLHGNFKSMVFDYL
jgi:predicted RND superfamily exporter protein